MLTPTQRGARAEAAVLKRAIQLGVPVYRPAFEGTRCDMIFEVGETLVRIQCKAARIAEAR